MSGQNPLDRESIEEASRRAANEPHQFDAADRARYVRAMIARVTEYMRDGKSVELIKEYVPEFVRDYQNLFEMITSPAGYDKRNLEIMLSMLDHMHSGRLSQHEASVIVGKRLYEKFGHTVGKPPTNK